MCCVGIYISAIDLQRKEVISIVLRLKASLSEAYRDSRHGTSTDRTMSRYYNTLTQSVIGLQSLGYPIISFYVDHHLSLRLFNQQHNTLVNTFYKLMYTTGRLSHSCSQDTAHGRRKSLCGSVHLHNQQSIQSEKFTMHVYIMQVPHMFYIQIQCLEVILLGGLRHYECERYQFIKVKYFFVLPFSFKQSHFLPGILVCGTRPPFAIVVPRNGAQVESKFNVNKYASFKLRYSAMDIQVSTEPRKGQFFYIHFIFGKIYALLSNVLYLFFYI